MTEISRPIFIIGIQRSGTTILDNLFTRHKETAFFEGFCNRYYMSPWKFRLIPFQVRRYKARPASTEGRVWRRYFREIDYVDETMLTDEMRRYYYSAIRAELAAFRAKRFVNKNPSHCLRLRWLDAMFPDAMYILIWREPKAVVNSIYRKMLSYWEMQLNTEYEHGYKGYVTIKEVFGKQVSKLESCINFYKYNREMLEKDLPIISSERLTRVSYEEFIERPRQELARLYDFAGLSWYDGLEKYVPEKLILENNSKWEALAERDREILETAFPSATNSTA
ncbi:MAG TPA: sulfotransferase [Nitrososphaera sp.]|nr:sulfotransferase [Nitrososphaera sp.]